MVRALHLGDEDEDFREQLEEKVTEKTKGGVSHNGTSSPSR